MSACEAVLVPVGGDRYQLVYRVVRAGLPQVPRPASAMAAVVVAPEGCPR